MEERRTPEGGDSHTRIETRRLTIRRFQAPDWSGFRSLTNDYNASNGGIDEGQWPSSEEHCRKSVEFMGGSDRHFAVCLRESGRLIAMLVLNGVENGTQMDLGYIVDRRYQDCDHDREAMEAMVARLFGSKEITSVVVRWRSE